MAALIGADSPYPVSVVLQGAVFGFGTAASFTPITVVATGGVPREQGGLAVGLPQVRARTRPPGPNGCALSSLARCSSTAAMRAATVSRHSGPAASTVAISSILI